MADYIYRTTLYHDTADVASVPADNSINVSDFETNHLADVIDITEIQVGEIAFTIEKDYSGFDSLIVTPLDWGDVKCITTAKSYELYLITSEAL